MFDAIIVLGGGYNQQDWKARVDKAISLYHKKIAQVIILSGKHSYFRKTKITEAEDMKRYAVQKGIPETALIKEEKSVDTATNAYFTKHHVLMKRNWKSAVTVTSDYHAKRARMVFRSVFGKGYKIRFATSKPRFSSEEKNSILKHERMGMAITRDIARLLPINDVAAVEDAVMHAAEKRKFYKTQPLKSRGGT